MKIRLQPLLFALLAFVLLFAQQGAFRHALSHMSENAPAHSQQDKQIPHSPACDECVAYAGVGSAVAASTPFPPAGILFVLSFFSLFTACVFPASRAYHSRAPPFPA